MSKLTSLPALLLLLLPSLHAQPASSSAARPVELKWGELSSLIRNQKVSMVLPDATMISGEAIVVREDALVIDVKKTSNASAYHKGHTPIPRASVTLLQLERRNRKGARVIGTTVGVIGGVIGGGYVALLTADDSPGGFAATWTSLATAGSVGGYLLGKEIDSKTTYIKVVE